MAPKKDRAAPSISAKRSMKYRVLRVNKPVQTQLSMDVWDRIFANSRPEVLFKLRLVCAGFRDALSPDVSLWKESLDLEFGSAVPSPPRGLSWLNYAILLTVRCCQACGTKDNTKIFWAFERRYCKSCLERKTVLVCALHMLMNEHTDILALYSIQSWYMTLRSDNFIQMWMNCCIVSREPHLDFRASTCSLAASTTMDSPPPSVNLASFDQTCPHCKLNSKL